MSVVEPEQNSLNFYCCVTNYLKAQLLKTTNIYYLSVSADLESKSDFEMGASGSGFLLGLQSRCQPELQSLKV